MKLQINLDNSGLHIPDLITKQLLENDLPSCMGYMILPMLNPIQEFEDTDILVPEGSIPTEANVGALQDMVVDISLVRGRFLTIDGYQKIISRKEKLVKEYVEQCIKCVNCRHVDVCHKLTQNTIKSIKLLHDVQS